MEGVRTPVRSSSRTSDFRRPGGMMITTYGALSNSESKNTAKDPLSQPRDNTPIIHGVRIKHDPKNLQKPSFGEHGRRWHSLEETGRRILRREKNRAYFPNMQPLLRHPAQYNDNGTLKKKGRKRPSQRVESMVNLLLPWLLHSFNLKTGSCGYYAAPEDGAFQFINYDYNYFTKTTGLTLIRVKRCMKVLIEQGICTVSSIYEEDEYGNVKTVKVIIKLTNKIFQMMGTEKAYLVDLERAARAFKRKEDTEHGKMTKLKITQANIRTMPQDEKHHKNPLEHIISEVKGVLPSQYLAKQKAAVQSVSRPKTQEEQEQYKRVLTAALELQTATRVEVSPGKWEKPDFKDCVRKICLKFGYDPPH